MVMNTKKQSWDEFGEKMEKDRKGNQKSFFRILTYLRREKLRNTKQLKNKRREKIMDRWKEYFAKLLNVKCERQTGDDEEKDIKEQKEETRNEGIRIEGVTEAIHVLKGEK